MRSAWLAVSLALCLLAPPAPAADDHKHDGPKDAKAGESAKGGGHEGGHGERSIFQGLMELTIWTIVVFLLLFVVLTKFAWKPLLEGLHQREHNIHAAAEEAKKAREEAQQLREQIEKDRVKMAEETRALMEEARRDAQRVKEELTAEGKREVQAERERLHRDLETARDQALQELWNQTAQLATLVSSQVLGRSVGGDDHRRLVDEALNELGPSGRNWRQQAASIQR